MPLNLIDIKQHACTKCTYTTYSESAIRSHILDMQCKAGATSYHERALSNE